MPIFELHWRCCFRYLFKTYWKLLKLIVSLQDRCRYYWIWLNIVQFKLSLSHRAFFVHRYLSRRIERGWKWHYNRHRVLQRRHCAVCAFIWGLDFSFSLFKHDDFSTYPDRNCDALAVCAGRRLVQIVRFLKDQSGGTWKMLGIGRSELHRKLENDVASCKKIILGSCFGPRWFPGSLRYLVGRWRCLWRG